MNHSISRSPETAKRMTFFYRGKVKHWIVTALNLTAIACPCSKLLAKNPLPTPVVEVLAGDKTTKETNFLDDLINHNAFMGLTAPFALDPNATHLIFAMNHNNEQGEKKSEHSEEPEGAGAQQLQPLMTIPLPPMSHAQITAIIQGLDTGLYQDTLNTLLAWLPEASDSGNLTIADMIEQVKQTLNIEPDPDQEKMMEVLSSIQGTESPVDLTKPEDRESLARLLVSYYAAIHSRGASQEAYDFFDSFLLYATGLSGIERLEARKGELLGTKEPIESHLIMGNVKESASVFSGLKLLQKMRLRLLRRLWAPSESINLFRYLQRLEIPMETEELLEHLQRIATPSERTLSLFRRILNPSGILKFEEPPDPTLEYASSLLNRCLDMYEIPFYERTISSTERTLEVIKEQAEKRPVIIASNNQFTTLMNAIGLILDPFKIQDADELIDNMSSYFSQSNWDQTITDSEGKEQKLFDVFKKLITDAKENPGNENPELFQELLLAIEKYLSQHLEKMFMHEVDRQVIFSNLVHGFSDLRRQSWALLEMLKPAIDTHTREQADEAQHDKAAKAQKRKELSNEEKKRKYLRERIEYLDDFYFRFGCKYGNWA
ncbi:hypothetical protein [Endozoicomonas sp. ALB032]|uniref:hypothetical protein n=1 Tax=Endozoicomonas sp. ALB032 TaxID=3403082 RepID=UPI003BB58FCB